MTDEVYKALHRYMPNSMDWAKEASKYGLVDLQVFRFIWNFYEVPGWDYRSEEAAIGKEALRRTYRAGYCWHFAMMLQNVFQRGTVCLVAPIAHCVWVDVDGTAYDCEGVYFDCDGTDRVYVPCCELNDYGQSFKHIPGVMFANVFDTEADFAPMLEKWRPLQDQVPDWDSKHNVVKFLLNGFPKPGMSASAAATSTTTTSKMDLK